MQDNELFELCQEVYKAFPEWKTVGSGWTSIDGNNWDPFHTDRNLVFAGGVLPFLPDSDYLLEKLPHFILPKDRRYTRGADLQLHDQSVPKSPQLGGGLDVIYGAMYKTPYGIAYIKHADTPLKALLKLTIALKEAGEL